MDDETINRYITTLTEQLITAAGQISKLRASVSILRLVLAAEINRDHPETALAFFRQLEQKFLDADPNEQEQKEATEIIADWKKSGGKGEA